MNGAKYHRFRNGIKKVKGAQREIDETGRRQPFTNPAFDIRERLA